MYTLSVCIPVYNAEKYLDDCLAPLLCMGDEVQIILSDNDSEDSSLEICRRYGENYPNVVVLTGPNGGSPSTARNRALERVEGEYTTFVDADDWLETEALSHLKKITAACKVDYIQFGIVSESPNGMSKKPLLYEKNTVLNEEQQKELFNLICGHPDRRDLGAAYFGLVSCKFFRTALLQGLRFDPQVVGEDTLYALQAVKRAKSAVFLAEALYHYRIVPGSFSRRYFPNIVPMAANMLEQMRDELEISHNRDKESQTAYFYHAYGKLKWCLEATGYYDRKNEDEQRQCLKALCGVPVFAEMLRKIPFRYLSKRRILTVLLLRFHAYEAARRWLIL